MTNKFDSIILEDSNYENLQTCYDPPSTKKLNKRIRSLSNLNQSPAKKVYDPFLEKIEEINKKVLESNKHKLYED
jgi:hypothetical protein